MQASRRGEQRPSSSRHGTGQTRSKEESAVESGLIDKSATQSQTLATSTLEVVLSPAEIVVPHASFRSHDWSAEPDNQHAPASGKGASQPALEAPHHANTAAAEEPGVARQQPQISQQDVPHPAEQERASGVYEMPLDAHEAPGPQRGTTPLEADLVTSTAGGAVQQMMAEHGVDGGEGKHQAGQDTWSAGGAQSRRAEGAQQGITEQVMHLMSPGLPISSAMREAARLVEQDGLVQTPKWVYKSRRRQSKAERYSWRKVGRGWRRRIFRKQ